MQLHEFGALPQRIQTEEQLEEVLTRPRQELVDFITGVKSPLVILGAGGKMGPTLAVLAKRAADAVNYPLKITAVSRFSEPNQRRWFEERGIETVACDLLNRHELEKLPDAENVIYLVGLKFGTAKNPGLTWVMNTVVPANVAERYASSRMVVLSTGNVYPLVRVERGGASESDPLTPLGEYSNAAVARERVFQYYAQKHGTPVVISRLNYAVELRYGVLLDIAERVWCGEPIDLTTGYFNCIWQGDANEWIIRLLAEASVPLTTFNMTGPENLSVRDVSSRFGALMGKDVVFEGAESDTALLSSAARLTALLGQPPTDLDLVMKWIADWVRQGGRTLGKPTQFEIRHGNF